MDLLDLQNLDPFSLESVTYEDRRLLPGGPGVYFALTMPSTVSYIGLSRSIKRRWYRHDKRKGLNLKAVRIAWLPVPEPQLRETEEALIRRFNPSLNGVRIAPAEGFIDLPAAKRSTRPALICAGPSTEVVTEWDDKGMRWNGRVLEDYLIGFHAPIVPEPPWLVEKLASCGGRMNTLYAMQKIRLVEMGATRFPEHESPDEALRFLNAFESFYIGTRAPDRASV